MTKSTRNVDFLKELAIAFEEMRPIIEMDGGDIRLEGFDFETGNVEVSMHGACVGCPASSVTLQQGIKKFLQAKFKIVKDVVIAAQMPDGSAIVSKD